MKSAHEKYVKMHAKFVPCLVRNSLHFCSVFLGENMVLNVTYFEDHPQKDVAKYNILRIILKIDVGACNSLRITLKWQFEIYICLRIVLNHISKAATGAEYEGSPPLPSGNYLY